MNHWEDAKTRYNEKIEGSDTVSEENKLGYMRCLEALGQWDELTEKSNDFMTTDSNNLNQNGMVILTDDKAKTRFREAAKLATMAAWHKENWENFEQNMKHIPTGKFLKNSKTLGLSRKRVKNRRFPKVNGLRFTCSYVQIALLKNS